MAGDLVPFSYQSPRVLSDAEAEKVNDLIREFSQHTVWRSTTAGHCEEIAELILPTSRNTFFYQNFNWPGAKKTQQQVDSTGALALHRFCAIADSLVTPRNSFWHGLESDPYVMKDRASKLWLENATRLLFRLRYAANANFAGQNYNNWQSLGAFGNATMYVDKFDNRWHRGIRGFRYKSIPFGETFYGENHQGKVDRMFRWFKLTAFQAVQKWGLSALPQNLIAPLQQNSNWPYNFLHVVKPRDDYDPSRLDVKALPFCSYYVSMEGRCLLPNPGTGRLEGGYRTFPFTVSRYDQTPGEIYGRGPAHIVLPTMKTLNAMKSVHLKQGHRAADPILLLADDGLMGMDNRPGARNPGGVNSDGRPLVHILPTGDIKISEEMMGEERGIVDDVFLVSIYKTLVENPNMKATQVIQIVNERGMLVAPTLGRQHTEYAGGLVEREMDLAAEMRLLEPMPGRLAEAKGAYEVTDTSPLAKAAAMGEAVGFNTLVETLSRTANETGDPSWLDIINRETSARDLADIYSVRESWLSTDDQMAQKAKARQNAQAQAARAQALPGEAAMLNAQTKAGTAQQQQGPVG